MKIYHNTQIVNGRECIMLYVDYPSDYEFSLDFEELKKNALDLNEKIRDYATEHFKNLTSDTTILILNGVALGTLLTAALINKINIKGNDKSLDTGLEVVEVIESGDSSKDEKNEEFDETSNEEENKEESDEEASKEEENAEKDSGSQTSGAAQTSAGSVAASSVNASTSGSSNSGGSSSSSNNNSNNSGSSSTSNNSGASQPQTSNERMVNVKLSSGQVVSLTLEDYVTGVVASEMPASFNTEALKAQAVAARTYALKRTANGATLSATTADQIYKTTSELQAMWGASYSTYYSKVKSAVEATKGQYMTYGGNYIEALYFSTSNGRTENAENVWKDAYPYLVSVESPWDVGIPSYSGSKTVAMSTISEKLGVTLTSSSQIQILERTQGNRVKKVSICGKEYTGVQIRTIFGLRSADFDVSASGDNIVFTTRGYGHGVGMSQYGAHLMAKAGYSYRQILTHYYTGVQINSL